MGCGGLSFMSLKSFETIPLMKSRVQGKMEEGLYRLLPGQNLTLNILEFLPGSITVRCLDINLMLCLLIHKINNN